MTSDLTGKEAERRLATVRALAAKGKYADARSELMMLSDRLKALDLELWHKDVGLNHRRIA